MRYVFHPDKISVVAIIKTPHQRQIASIIVKKSLATKTGMVRIRLTEFILVSAGVTFNNHKLNWPSFGHGRYCIFR